MLLVAPRKKTGRPDSQPRPPKPNRTGTPIQVYLDDDLAEAFDRFRRGQRVPPTKTDVAVVAIQEFLKAEGYWPLSDRDDDED